MESYVEHEPVSKSPLEWPDIIVIALYFAMVIAVGIWSSMRSQRSSVSGYFLAGRNMHWVPVGASLFASNIGSGHFIGLAGSGASSGIGIAGFELNALYILLLLGWFFVPVYISAGVYTMPEYLRKRFGGQRIRVYLSVLALLLYVFTKISADLFAGAIFIEQSVKLNLWGAVTVLLTIAAIFTIAGGLSAVIWTDFVQTILMLVGAFILMVLSFMKVGGYSKLVESFGKVEPAPQYVHFTKDNKSCSSVPQDYMSLLRSPTDAEIPWTGMIFGLTINAVWYWCSDQVIVQRALSAKNLTHAKGGCLLSAYLKLLPLFLLVLPGMAARVLFTDKIGCTEPKACKEFCNNEYGCTNIAYPTLVLELMPPGLRGLMISVMLAALMSSLTSIFNSSSTLFTIDIWTRFRKSASSMELLIVGRLFVVFLVVVSILWIPIIQGQHNSQLFHYIQSVTSYLAPPVCAVYVLAMFWERINEKGAFWGLMVGLVIGLIRFGLDIGYQPPLCGDEDTRPPIVGRVHYLHFGCILFVIIMVITTVISLLTDPIPKEKLYRLTYWTRHSEGSREDIRSKKSSNGVCNVGFQTELDTATVPMPLTPPCYKISSMMEPEFPVGEKAAPSLAIRLLNCACGLKIGEPQPPPEPPITPEEEAKRAVEFIREHPVWKAVCSTNALLVIAIASFFWGYYGHA